MADDSKKYWGEIKLDKIDLINDKFMSQPKWDINAPAFRLGETVKTDGIEEIGVIIDCRPEIDTYVVEFPNIPNSVGYYHSHELRKVNSLNGAPKNDNPCRHEFRDYRGFIENYRYCIKCDFKD